MTTKAKRKRHETQWQQKCHDYARFLKDDFDFDWTYILLLLRYKLQRTRRCLAKGHHLHRDRDCKEIQEVEELLWKVCEHDYQEEAFRAFHKKHGKPKLKFYPVEGMKNVSRMEFLYRNGKTDTPAMSKEQRRLFKLCDERQRADLKKALDLMAEKIFGWWD